jgi:hypothetical protein
MNWMRAPVSCSTRRRFSPLRPITKPTRLDSMLMISELSSSRRGDRSRPPPRGWGENWGPWTGDRERSLYPPRLESSRRSSYELYASRLDGERDLERWGRPERGSNRVSTHLDSGGSNTTLVCAVAFFGGEAWGFGNIMQIQGAGVDWPDGAEVKCARIRRLWKSWIAWRRLRREAICAELLNGNLSGLSRLVGLRGRKSALLCCES